MARDIELRLQEGISNKGIVDCLFSAARGENPFEYAQRRFADARRGFFAGLFGVYAPFEYEGREINPIESVEKFLEDGAKLYQVGLEASFEMIAEASETGSLTKLKKLKGDIWTSEFRRRLKSEIRLAGDIAVWVSHLSERGWGVGASVKSNLAKYGIETPESLPDDVEAVGKKILRAYNALC